jgi:predicted Zn-dependent peptidase
MSREVSLLGFAWHAPGVSDRESVCAMDLIYTLLGEQASGRLQRVLVQEKRIALSVDAQFLTQKEPGLMILNALVPRGREQEAQIAILDEVRKLADEPTSEADLEQAKRLLYADYAFTNESFDDQVASMGFYQSIDSYRFALDYITAVMGITPAQVQDVARRYLQPEAYSLVVIEAGGGRPADPGVQL